MIFQNHRRLPVSIFVVKIAALSLIFSATKKQKILQKEPVYYFKPSKKYSPRDTVPLKGPTDKISLITNALGGRELFLFPQTLI